MISSWCMILQFRHDLKEKRGQNPCRGAFTPATPCLTRCCPMDSRWPVVASARFMTLRLFLCYECRTELELHHEHDAS